MGSLSELFIAVILSLGLLIGYWLGKVVKEELKPGKKYFVIAYHILFLAVAAVYLYAHKWEIWHVTLGLAFVFFHMAYKKARQLWHVQAAFGIAFVFSTQQFLLGSLMFLFNLPTGTIHAMYKQGLRKILISGAVFLVIVGISYFL